MEEKIKEFLQEIYNIGYRDSRNNARKVKIMIMIYNRKLLKQKNKEREITHKEIASWWTNYNRCIDMSIADLRKLMQLIEDKNISVNGVYVMEDYGHRIDFTKQEWDEKKVDYSKWTAFLLDEIYIDKGW